MIIEIITREGLHTEHKLHGPEAVTTDWLKEFVEAVTTRPFEPNLVRDSLVVQS